MAVSVSDRMFPLCLACLIETAIMAKFYVVFSNFSLFEKAPGYWLVGFVRTRRAGRIITSLGAELESVQRFWILLKSVEK